MSNPDADISAIVTGAGGPSPVSRFRPIVWKAPMTSRHGALVLFTTLRDAEIEVALQLG